MDMHLDLINLLLIPLITGISLALEAAGAPKKYMPLMEMVIGMALAYTTIGGDWQSVVIVGLYSALAGRGFISGAKTTANGAFKKTE